MAGAIVCNTGFSGARGEGETYAACRARRGQGAVLAGAKQVAGRGARRGARSDRCVGWNVCEVRGDGGGELLEG